MAEPVLIGNITSDPQTISALQEYAARDNRLNPEVLDNNSDGYLDYKRSFLEDLNTSQFVALQKNLQRFDFQPRNEEDVQDAFETYQELKQAGLDGSEVYLNLESKASWFLNDYSWLLPSLLPVFGSSQNLIQFLDRLISTPPWSKRDYWQIRFTFSFLRRTQTPLLEGEWSDYLKTLSFLLSRIGKPKLKNATKAIEQLAINWRACGTLPGFGEELARGLNHHALMTETNSKWVQTWSDVSAMISRIHSKDGSYAFISALGKGLSDRAFYQLVGLNYGGHLMTIVFDILWRPRKVGSVSTWLGQVDPENKLRGRFLKSISSLDRIRIFINEVDFVFGALFSELKQKQSDLLPFATAITHYLEELLPKSSTSSRKKLAQELWNHYHTTAVDSHGQSPWYSGSRVSGGNLPGEQREREGEAPTALPLEGATRAPIIEPRIQKAFAFWIQYYTPRYHLERFKPELALLQTRLPSVSMPQIPKERWLQDKQLQARVYFYSDQEYTTVESEKGDEQKWFEYTQKLLMKNYGWKIEKMDLSSETKICVLEKRVGQTTLKITLTLQDQDEDKTLPPLPDQNQYELIVHRGHWEPLKKTFPLEEGQHPFQNDIPRLMYLGACKSMSYAATEEFQRSYGQDLIISDLDVSRGETSTEFLNQWMTDIALGKASWKRYKRYQRVYKIVFPDSPISLIGQYLTSV